MIEDERPRLLSLEEAEREFPEAIARLREDRDFLDPHESLVDEYDAFVAVPGFPWDLLFANTLDMDVDVWDDVDGCWMKYTPSEWDWDTTPERAEEAFWKMISDLKKGETR